MIPTIVNIPCALDSAIPKKKIFYRELIRSLKSIANTSDRQIGRVDNEQNRLRAGAGAGAGKASEIFAETMPKNPKAVDIKMRPSEVRDMIKRSCSLIKTVPKGKKIEGIERRIKRLHENTNTTKSTLQRYLEKSCGLKDWEAKRIIDDQCLKFAARKNLAILKARGVKMVRWCAGDAHEHRPSHIASAPQGLNGCIFPIDHPPIDPATGRHIYPGDEINCHCYLEAVE